MAKVSAGLMMYRLSGGDLEIFLVHPGGPYWARKDEGAWSIPKGLVNEAEETLEAAKREFIEETAIVPSAPFIHLGEIRQRSGKRLCVWAFETERACAQVKSNTFTLEWPPKSGLFKEFPEIDRGEFFPLKEALKKVNPSQAELVQRLQKLLEKAD